MSDADVGEALRRPQLHASLEQPVVTIDEEGRATAVLRVRNTSSVIDRIDVRLVGLLAESVVCSPAELRLFPGEEGEVTLDLVFTTTLPADVGPHEGILVVSGRSETAEAAELPLLVESPARPAVEVVVEPPLRTGRKRATYDVHVRDVGNTSLEVLLQAVDADRVLDLTLTQRKHVLRPTQGGYAVLGVRAPRRWTGPPTDHVLTVTAAAEHGAVEAEARFRQRAILTPGVVTILTLLLIVALWTLAMYLGVLQAFSPPEPAKAVPLTMAEGVKAADLDPSGTVGGGLSGTVLAASTDLPVARVTVEVFDQRGAAVTAVATGDDGTFSVAGLLPGRYRLRITAPGFEERWWPEAPDAAGAEPVLVGPGVERATAAVRLPGETGSLGGSVVTGDGPVPTTVVVEGLDLAVPFEGETTTDDAGVWSIAGLPAPATYRITFDADGFAPVELTQELAPGATQLVTTARLPAAPGAIRGRAVDRFGLPVGGVEVLAQRGDVALTTTTPTSGEVGSFVFEALETPGTYLLTFTADGYATETVAVPLGPGGEAADLEVVLAPGTGTIVGTAFDDRGRPLGGVRVTVSGGEEAVTTETLTSGEVGAFRVAGLALPGTYTVTFETDGYERASVQAVLSADAPEAGAVGRLVASVGDLAGSVVDRAGRPIVGAEVEVSDGVTVRTTTTASAPSGERGRFTLLGLTPASYTITVRTPEGSSTTVLVTVEPGQVTRRTIEVRS